MSRIVGTRLIVFVKTGIQAMIYRLWQVREQLGFAAPLTTDERREVARWLPTSAYALFTGMSPADQRHSVRVCLGLQARGCTEPEMLAAALLHDVGKAQGRVPFWTRPVIVVGKCLAPRLLQQMAVYPREGLPAWRRALGQAWWHAEIGADMAAAAGLPERAVLYIRTHHQSRGPAAELHLVDEAS
jgi:hypothetical protein